METARLSIRPMAASDKNAFVQGIQDRSFRLAYGFPPDMDDTVPPQIFDRFCKLNRAYVLVRKEKNQMIGFLLDVDPELPADRITDLPGKGRTFAYAVFPPYQRQGYMQEALQAYIPSLFQNDGISFIHCGHFPENTPSSNLLAKLGFREYTEHMTGNKVIIDEILRK